MSDYRTPDYVIQAPFYRMEEEALRPIFLAGPIAGGGNWQHRAIELIHQALPHQWIANPQRHPFAEDTPEHTQMYWETHQLNLAGLHGVILFWMPAEDLQQHDCSRSYAQTTRVELGIWLERAVSQQARLSIGRQDDFSGRTFIDYQAQLRNIPTYNSLEATCQAAVSLLS